MRFAFPQRNRPLQGVVPPVAQPVGAPARPATAARFVHDFSRISVRSPVAIAEEGTAGGGGPLPHLATIQRSFGHHDVGQVTAHDGSLAAEAARALGASAYTSGGHVAFGRPPDLRTAAHEAAHAVQQRAGLAPSGDVDQPGDRYERHADAVADQVVRGRSVETFLDQVAPVGSRAAGVQRRVVQRAAIKTNFGEFDTTKYDSTGPSGSEDGVEINLTFDPDTAKANATKIGLTQSVRSQLAGAAVAVEPSRHKRLVPSKTGKGREIDRTTLSAFSNPIYATAVPSKGDKLRDTPMLSHGQWGWNYKDKSGKAQHQIAKLDDTPTLPERGNNAAQTFETAALAVEGTQSGTYMGSVSWGWRVDGAGKFSKLPLTRVSKGNPSAGFVAAAKRWNKWRTAGTIKTTPSPTNVYDDTYSVAFTVAKDTEVQVTGGSYISNDELYSPVTINSGPDIGQTGRIKVNDLRDVGGGKRTIKLPIP